MPCFDPRDTWSSEHNNAAAQLLCKLLGSMPDDLLEQLLTDAELGQWWKDHNDRDAMYARKQAEHEPK